VLWQGQSAAGGDRDIEPAPKLYGPSSRGSSRDQRAWQRKGRDFQPDSFSLASLDLSQGASAPLSHSAGAPRRFVMFISILPIILFAAASIGLARGAGRSSRGAFGLVPIKVRRSDRVRRGAGD
jgi:hypothetical protein